MFSILLIKYIEFRPNWKVPSLKNEIAQCQCLLTLVAIVKTPYFKFLFKSLLSFSAAFKFNGLASQHLVTATVFHLQISQFLACILQFIIQLLEKIKALGVTFAKIIVEGSKEERLHQNRLLKSNTLAHINHLPNNRHALHSTPGNVLAHNSL